MLDAGEVTARELLDSCVSRMGPTRALNAFIGGVTPNALRDADAADARIRRRLDPHPSRGRSSTNDDDDGANDAAAEMDTDVDIGDANPSRRSKPLSPIDGCPMVVKDNFCVPGAPTTAGSAMLRGYVPPEPTAATVTARLRAAGAVLFAKTNMDEFGMGSEGRHSSFGACLNPWMARHGTSDRGFPSGDADDAEAGPRVAGGSSGGSAAAVASGAAIAAVGSDTGGSVRLPAAYTGLVGLKPSYGRLSRWGLIPYCSSLDCPGFLTKDVADAVAMLRVTQGRDELDATTIAGDERLDRLAASMGVGAVDAANRRGDSPTTTGGFLKSHPGYPLWGWRVGVPSEYNVAELSEEVRSVWSAAAATCEALGATVVPVSLPHTPVALAAYYILAQAEASSNLARYDGLRFGAGVTPGVTSSEVNEAREAVAAAAGKALEGVASIGGVTGVTPPPPLGDAFHAAVAAARTANFGREVRRRVLVGTYVLGTDLTSRYFDKAQRARRLVSEDFRRVFSGGGGGGAGGGGAGSARGAGGNLGRATGVDILLTPTAPTCAPLLYPQPAEIGAADTSATAGYAADVMTVPVSLAGLPAVSIPAGLGRESGLPVGVQLVAGYGAEMELLRFAAALEGAIREAGARGGGAGPLGERTDAGVLGWTPEHSAQGMIDAVRFSAMGHV